MQGARVWRGSGLDSPTAWSCLYFPFPMLGITDILNLCQIESLFVGFFWTFFFLLEQFCNPFPGLEKAGTMATGSVFSEIDPVYLRNTEQFTLIYDCSLKEISPRCMWWESEKLHLGVWHVKSCYDNVNLPSYLFNSKNNCVMNRGQDIFCYQLSDQAWGM